jgi:hypothetical protein
MELGAGGHRKVRRRRRWAMFGVSTVIADLTATMIMGILAF